jgi:hypothetical protein
MGYKRNEDTLKELKTEPIVNSILKDKTNWIQHVDRIQKASLPKLFRNDNPHGLRIRRDI